MKILILGGTRFVGRHIARAALAERASVTLFHRGKTSAPELEQCEHVFGNRDTDLHRLGNRKWDAVVDTSAYTPNTVEISARYLAERTARYVFISTISVYDHSGNAEYIDEDSPLARLAPDHSRTELRGDFANYGSLKVLCEAVVKSMFRQRATIVRPGLVAGPLDHTDRFTYWPVRVDAGGAVLAPDGPQHDIQYVDARDLAAFVVLLAARGPAGVFNTVTGVGQFRFGDLLDAAKRASATNAEVVYAPEEFLLERNVQPWSDLPLWIPAAAPENKIVHARNVRALGAGLKVRSIADTARDTLAWARSERKSRDSLAVGVNASRESGLLELLHGASAL